MYRRIAIEQLSDAPGGYFLIALGPPPSQPHPMRALVFLLALALASPAQAQSLSDLAWLKGCWRTEAPREAESGAQITEVWIAPPGPAMFGYSYTEGEGEIQGWEQMRIEMIDGVPTFIAMPNGGAPVRFRAIPAEDTQIYGARPDGDAAFANPAHDFPQLVTYTLFDERLRAMISRIDGGDAIIFEYRRIACPAELRP
ncbi:DUF6265 family protein [Terricaulis sp.]|uniref:DUF6265 family protein n=1 Tax=Terricaulis sp. TaxID=2768686 RepID=UPI003783647D